MFPRFRPFKDSKSNGSNRTDTGDVAGPMTGSSRPAPVNHTSTVPGISRQLKGHSASIQARQKARHCPYISMCHPTRVFREKMVANHVNPALEILLQVVVLVGAPFLWLFGLFHDHIMMKFLNKTYIYNVSWEVRSGLPQLYSMRRDLQSAFLKFRISNVMCVCDCEYEIRTQGWTSVCST